LLARHSAPSLGGHGFLPGEGAVALVLERTEEAQARSARVRASLGALSCRAGADRAAALMDAAKDVASQTPDVWIGGANGHPRVDPIEAALRARHADWPEPQHPKLLWGEFGGAGAQLLAAGLLEPARSALVTGPSSFGAQWALRWDAIGE
jgi:hypothetical protein